MKNYIYSARNNAFFKMSNRKLYECAGWDLSDAIEVEDVVFNEFTGEAPTGKERIAGKNGLPGWGDIPPPTPEEISHQNLYRAQEEYNKASIQITMLNELVEDDDWNGTSKEEVMGLLDKFTEYRKLLRAYIKNSSGGSDFPMLNK